MLPDRWHRKASITPSAVSPAVAAVVAAAVVASVGYYGSGE